MYNRNLTRILVAIIFIMSLVGCSGSSGGGEGPQNPALAPEAETSIDMTGYWLVIESAVTATNTVDIQEFRVGDVIEVWQDQIIGRPDIGVSYLRPDIESSLGFPLGWYANSGNGSTLDFHLGWDRLSQGDGRENYGLRLAAVGPDELIGIESEEWQEESQFAQATWSAAFRLQRINSLPVQLPEASIEETLPRKRFMAPAR